MQSRLGRCPKCRNLLPIRNEKDGTDDNAPEHTTDQPRRGIGRRHDGSDEADRPARRRRHREVESLEEDLDEVVEEYAEEEEPRPKRPKRKRKKKPLRPLPTGEDERETPAWVWWVGGGAGIGLTFLTLIVIYLTAPTESNLKTYAVILLVTLPISTVIFFVAMIAASMLLGAV